MVPKYLVTLHNPSGIYYSHVSVKLLKFLYYLNLSVPETYDLQSEVFILGKFHCMLGKNTDLKQILVEFHKPWEMT